MLMTTGRRRQTHEFQASTRAGVLGSIRLSFLIDDNLTSAPAGWLEVLAECDADLAAGRIVFGDVVPRDLKDSLARLEAKVATQRVREATAQN